MIVGVLLWLCLVPLGLATLVFVTETGVGLFGPVRRAHHTAQAIRIAILVPAHDEATGIARTIAALLARTPAGTRILVIADNCSDATAETARNAGAEVIERFDAQRRGKGYALAFGRDHLAADAPDCVIIIDADSLPEPGCIELLAQRSVVEQRPVQACYLMEPSAGATAFTRFSSFAFMIKNLIRLQGTERIGAPSVLTGCGMAFTWASLAHAPLANDEVAEDLALGVHMAMTGWVPCFEAAARVSSAASSNAGTQTQRKRWESGFLRTARVNFLPLLGAAARRGDLRLAWLALHLATPPFILLIVGQIALTLLAGAAWMMGGHIAVMLAPFGCLAACAGLVAIAWLRYGRAMLSLGDLARLPGYAAWKLRLSISAVLHAERRWIRTERTP